jgi:hypothetical protein
VTTTSAREFKVAGFVNTSHGRVDTEVRQSVNFKNVQNFDITSSVDTQDIFQETNVVSSTTTTREGGHSVETQETFSYPLTVDITLTFAADGSATQVTTAAQEFKNNVWSPFSSSFVDNKVNSTDTLALNSSFDITGNSGAKSSQSYKAFDSRGEKYSCSLASENNALTSVSGGCPGSNK